MTIGEAGPGNSPFTGLAGLERLVRPAPKIQPGERCELCGEPVPDEHSHVANLEHRSVMCACRACYLLFTHRGASGGKYRAIPDRYRYDPSPQLTDMQWDELQIPVKLAFFFHNSTLQTDVCFYPGPGGAMESELPLDAWSNVVAGNPEFADLAPDVEALLVQRRDGSGFEFFGVPIDTCYELVGLVRLNWKGFDGGQDVWRELGAFFDRLRERSTVVGGGA
ncbi:MAG: hypothetical protein JWN54_542 [Mycobacterium sp.]|jgi:hypothetical protein|nr:hypothetical protein [Mycobacterium sp.]